MILLTDEEIEAILVANLGGNTDDLNIAKAQLKKIVEFIGGSLSEAKWHKLNEEAGLNEKN